MKPRYTHRWDVSYEEAVAIQRRLIGRLDLSNRLQAPLRRIAGADCAYDKARGLAYAAVVVLDEEGRTVEEAAASVPCSFPYIPGLLTFREGVALLAAFERIRRPDVIIFDGQGIAHPRGIGLASHMGVLLDVPSVGCAKSRLCGEHEDVGEAAGSRCDLRLGGRVIGAVVRTRERARPVYVSPGQYVDVPTAVEVVLGACRGYRLPEPTRLAHNAVTRLRREGE